MRSDELSAPAPPAPGTIQVEGHERQELSGGWQVASCAAGSCESPAAAGDLEWLPATVPGTAAGALRDAGLWAYGDGRDFDGEDWWFRVGFAAAPADPGERVLLRLDGVATVYEVFLNGARIGGGDSMFAAAAIDVGELLREEENELAVRCLALSGLLGGRRKPRARWRTRLADNRLRFFRTMLLGRCPGFAPGPAAVGPWRPVWLERRRGLAVSGVELRTTCEGADGILSVRLRGRGIDGAPVEAASVVAVGPDGIEVETPLATGTGADGEPEMRGELRVGHAARWWPHTHGDPALYRVWLSVRVGEEDLRVDAGNVGFRTLLPGPSPDQDVPMDGIDLHVNGVRVFVRGAVWTPVDFVGMAVDRDRLRKALQQVREAGMNMLRIPGTAVYESRHFHDLCDELGILVWQDFMFANFDYPIADEDFRVAVDAEADEQLAAIAGRPSLAVVCGNSEVEQQVAMLGLDPEIGRGELFGDLLPAALAKSGGDAIYVPSSPFGGERPFRPDRGIANYYGVGGYRRPLVDARLAAVRFAGECLAVANVPEEAGIEEILPSAPADVVVHHPRWKAGVPRDAGTGWDFDDVRDHYLQDLFGVAAADLRRYDHERYLELSRAVSGEAMAAVFGEWRRDGSPSGGGLVLWLHDLMPGAGWGLIDSAGRPKLAFERLRAALAPIAIWMTDEGLAGVGVHLANDRPEPLGANLRITLHGESGRVEAEVVKPLDLAAHTTVSHDLESVLGRFVDASWAYRFGPPAQAIYAALEMPDGDPGNRIAEAIFFPRGRPSAAGSAEEMGLEVVARRAADGRLEVRMRARRLLWGLRAGSSGHVSEVGPIVVEPGRERLLKLRAEPDAEPATSVSVNALNLRGKVAVAVS